MLNNKKSTFLLLVTLLWGCSASEPSGFEFALVGDNPYPPEAVPKFERLINDINQEQGIRWVIHLGDVVTDTGRGTVANPCSDAELESRFDLFQRFQAPFLLTPGDNDWWDCGIQREGGGGGLDPVERLEFVRQLFYPQPEQSLGGRSLRVRSQSTEPRFEEFVENVMWEHDRIVFSTIHLVGMDNRVDADHIPTHDRMVDAALAWIDQSFAYAEKLDSPGIFLATQADLWPASGFFVVLRNMCAECLDPRPGLEPIYPALIKATVAFGRPVVLAVGDTHVFRVDKPLLALDSGTVIENFTRVEVFGNPYVHWVRVKVDPTAREVFSFQQEIIPENVVK